MSTADDDAMARSEQLAADLQLAYEVQAQLEQEQAMEQQLAAATNQAAYDSNVLGGGASTTTGINNPFASLQSMISQATAPRSQSHSLLDDGSSAMESNGSLLYVPCQINGRMVEMMVDSGSQTSVVSSSMMNTLNLQRRLNPRFQGVAAGVGAARILGRIENCPVMIGNGVEFNLFFLVIDVPHDMMVSDFVKELLQDLSTFSHSFGWLFKILGVDQMRRFKCVIDLENNVLVFGGHQGIEVPFLPPTQNHANAREQCVIS
jgi:Aspartyl protease